MVLSNAERQRRYRQARKAAASSAITRDMVLRAARAVWEHATEGDAHAWTWERSVEHWNKRGKRDGWVDLLRFSPEYLDDDELFAEFGADGDTVRAVARVLAMIERPPQPGE
jgi:hypothetical protein